MGLNEPVFKILKKFVKTQKRCNNEYKYTCLMRCHWKKNLNYECKSDLVESFEDHSTQGRLGLIANFVLVFMIVGIRKKVKQPIAHYFSSGFATAHRLTVLMYSS